MLWSENSPTCKKKLSNHWKEMSSGNVGNVKV